MMMPSRRLSVGQIIFDGSAGQDVREDEPASCPVGTSMAREEVLPVWSTGRTGPESWECRLCSSFHEMKRSQWKVQNLWLVWKVLERSKDNAAQLKYQISQ